MSPDTWSKLPGWLGPLVPWVKGLVAAAAGAAFGAAGDALVIMLESGQSPFTPTGRAHIGHVALVTAVATVVAYVQRSPRPRKEWSEDQRAAHKAKLAAQNRLP